jgi:hypothetical protein
MVNLYILLIFLSWIISILGYGSLLSFFYNSPKLKEFGNFKNIRLAVFGIFGLTIISILGNLANFFVPLNLIFSIIIFFLGVILFTVNFKNIFFGYGRSEIILIIILFVYLLFVPFNWASHYDTGYYYLPSIKWLRESIVPFGLANLHGMLGYNSSWFTVAAIVETPLFIKESPLFIINALMMFFYGSAAFLIFFEKIKVRKILFSDYFLIFALTPWFIRTRSNMASPAPDLPAMLIILFVIYLLIRSFEEKENNYFYFFNAILFSAFVVTIRLSTMPILIGSVSALIYYAVFIRKNFNLTNSPKIIFKSPVFYNNLIIPFFLAVISWIARGIILSGCLAYPSNIGYFKNLLWSANPNRDSKYILSWARGGLHASPKEVLGNWNWLGPWFIRLIKSGDKIILAIIIIGLLLLIAAIIRKNFLNNNKYYSAFFVPLAVSFSGVAFWFFTAPEPRYGYGFLFAFALLIFSYGFYAFKLPKHEEISKLAVIFLIVLFFLVEIVPLNVGINKIFTNTWPKLPEIEVIVKTTKEGVKINTPIKGDQCWNMELPAAPNFNPDLKIILSRDGKYKMFYYSK